MSKKVGKGEVGGWTFEVANSMALSELGPEKPSVVASGPFHTYIENTPLKFIHVRNSL